MFDDESLGLNPPDPLPQRPTKAQAHKAWLDFQKAANEMERLKAYPRMTAGMRDDFKTNLLLHTNSATILNRYFAPGRKRRG